MAARRTPDPAGPARRAPLDAVQAARPQASTPAAGLRAAAPQPVGGSGSEPASAGQPSAPAALLRARLRRALARSHAPSSDFDLSPQTPLPAQHLRAAAVLLAITPDQRVLLTKRSSRLKHHPGQIAFPGGKVDAGDAGVVAAALREAHEEIGLPAGAAEVLGTLPSHRTVTAFSVTPVVALVERFTPRPQPSEVEEVFSVPLVHLLQPAHYSVHGRLWQGQMRRYYAVPWGPHYIWGATARMLRALAECMALADSAPAADGTGERTG